MKIQIQTLTPVFSIIVNSTDCHSHIFLLSDLLHFPNWLFIFQYIQSAIQPYSDLQYLSRINFKF